MKVAVGSTNPVKIAAVKAAFSAVWPKKKWSVEGIAVASGVSDQPMSDTESIKGATTRAKQAIKKLHADFGVGAEGGLQHIEGKWFDSGWIVVINKKEQIGIGSSIRMQTPPQMIQMMQEKQMELGHVDDIFFKTENSKQRIGHFGHMSNNLITRTDAYKSGIISALSRFLHPELYE